MQMSDSSLPMCLGSERSRQLFRLHTFAVLLLSFSAQRQILHNECFIQSSLESTELGSTNRKWRWGTEYYNLTTCLPCSDHSRPRGEFFLHRHTSGGCCFPHDWPTAVNGLNCKNVVSSSLEPTFSSPPYVLHAESPEWYLVRSTEQKAPLYVVFSSLLLLGPS
jgi:hypothetical protein